MVPPVDGGGKGPTSSQLRQRLRPPGGDLWFLTVPLREGREEGKGGGVSRRGDTVRHLTTLRTACAQHGTHSYAFTPFLNAVFSGLAVDSDPVLVLLSGYWSAESSIEGAVTGMQAVYAHLSTRLNEPNLVPRIVAECREPLTQPPYYRDGVQELLLCDYGLFRQQRRGPLHANDPAALALVLPQDDVHASLVDRIDAYLEHHYDDPMIQFTMCDIRMQLLQAITAMRDAHAAQQPVGVDLFADEDLVNRVPHHRRQLDDLDAVDAS